MHMIQVKGVPPGRARVELQSELLHVQRRFQSTTALEPHALPTIVDSVTIRVPTQRLGRRLGITSGLTVLGRGRCVVGDLCIPANESLS
jgi:hypothetical protein